MLITSTQHRATAAAIELIPYDHEKHAAFVIGTFVDSLAGRPGRPDHVLARLLRDPSAVTLVAAPRGHAEDLLGWAMSVAGLPGRVDVGQPNRVLVFAYTRYIVRRRGVASELLTALDLPEPLPVVYWTRACSAMAQNQNRRHPYFDIESLDRVTALVH